TRRGFIWAGTLFATAAALPPGAVAQGSILRIRSNQDIQVIDPGWMIGGTEIDAQYACLGSLAIYDPGETLKWRPSPFVVKVEQVDDRHIAFELKPGIKWSGDFGELTAEDVKYSYERIANPANEAPWKVKWDALDHVEVTGTYTGTVILKQPFVPIWFTTICDGPGSIVCKKAVEAAGGRFTTEFPAVCGPYRIKRWVPKQVLELERNPLWSGEQPAFDEVHVVFITDPKAAELAYEAGEVSFCHVSLDSLPSYKSNPPAGSKLYEGSGLDWTWLGMNTQHTKLQDIKVRRAIQHAIDVNTIIAAGYGGAAEARARGIVPPGLIGHRTTTMFEEADLEKAAGFLEEAGVQDLNLTLAILNNSLNRTSAQIVQANLAEIGITVEIIPMDEGPFWSLGSEEAGDAWKDLQLYIHRYQDSPDPSQCTQWYLSSQVGIWNWERWASPEFDELHAQALQETDPAKRNDIYIRMQELMEEGAGYMFLAHEPVAIVYRDDLVPAILPPDHPYLSHFKRA
ncbi:MAG TPA: ABC transporter substrate-binding protein, partial [Geminicoccus sp.]|uniref:ABC transporter substrate-binding protein n=1 Tax=Geminicoccus sp. TaxID=2024832 RepID=UPI002E361845